MVVIFGFAIGKYSILVLQMEKKAGCFAIIVLQVYCHCKCSVALPHGAVGWSAMCDCGIS